MMTYGDIMIYFY